MTTEVGTGRRRGCSWELMEPPVAIDEGETVLVGRLRSDLSLSLADDMAQHIRRNYVDFRGGK